MNASEKRKLKRRGSKGTLIILALLLATSGALRLGDGIGIAVARAAAPVEEAQTSQSSPALNCPIPPVAVAEALSEREARVLAKETALEDRLAALALADQAIEIRLVKLASAEAKLNETLARGWRIRGRPFPSDRSVPIDETKRCCSFVCDNGT